MAEINKIPLLYLNSIDIEERRKLPEYQYHTIRLQRLVEMMEQASDIFQKEGLDYVVFKTLKPYLEDVSDIDVVNLGSHESYKKIVEILIRNNYIFMDKGVHCETFKDYKTSFKTEAMIDVYDEISVSRLIYLDKRKLSDYVIKKALPKGKKTNVFNPEVELIVTIAHSAIKENSYVLAEYYTTLHYLAEMSQESIKRFTDIVRENHLVKAARWHLTISCILHRITHGIVPEKLTDILYTLGNPWVSSYRILNTDAPPYSCDPFTLVNILREKLQDDVFRRSLCDQLLKSMNRAFAVRLLKRLGTLL